MRTRALSCAGVLAGSILLLALGACSSSSSGAPSGTSACQGDACDAGWLPADDAAAAVPDGAVPDDASLLGDGPIGNAAPFTVTAATTIGVPQNGDTTLHVTVTRTGGFTGPIAVSLLNLPAHVTAPSVLLTGSQSVVDLRVAADAVAALGDQNVWVLADGGGGEANASVLMHVHPPSGTLDSSFATAGAATVDMGGCDARAVSVTSTGGVLLVGCGFDGTKHAVSLALLTASGTPDSSFGSGGLVAPDFTGPDLLPLAAIVDGSGRVVVAGEAVASQSMFVARYLASGALDTSFGTSGIAIPKVSGATASAAKAVALQPDGSIVVAGWSENASLVDGVLVARFTDAGLLDSTFGTGGMALPTYAVSEGAQAVAVQPDGAIVVVGDTFPTPTTTAWMVARLTSTGAADTSFNKSGRIVLALSHLADVADAVALQPDGNIVVAGYQSDLAGGSAFTVARFTQAGVLDTSFGAMGLASLRFADGSTDVPSALALQADGRIVLAGSTRAKGSSTNQLALARFDPGGGLDLTFGSSGMVATSVHAGAYGGLGALALQADGRILAAGGEYVSGITQNAIVLRLWP